MRPVGLLLAALLALAACGDEAPEQVGFPAGLTAVVDQSRVERVGREAFVRLHDDGAGDLEVLRAELSSDRLPATVWSGRERIGTDADLEVELPLGRCGSGSDLALELTFRRGDGPVRRARTTAADRFGAIGLLLDRDCALRSLQEAAAIEVGTPRTRGQGTGAVLEVPVTLRPTGARDDVTFAGFDDTVLFRQAPGSASVAAGTRVSLAAGPARVRLRVVPARCDPHALAEDKVGTLFPMRVLAPGVPAEAGAYLPLDDATRAALRRFVPVACGW